MYICVLEVLQHSKFVATKVWCTSVLISMKTIPFDVKTFSIA